LDNDLRRRLREYLHQTKHLQIAAASKDLLALLSPALQGEVTWAVNRRWLSRVSFFRDAESEFLVQIALSLSPLVFTPGELAINGYLYIVHRGIALFGGRVLTSGKVWGEDCIISSIHLQRRWCARAMNYLEVFMISAEDVLEIAFSFPDTYIRIRRLAIRMAVRRQFILAAKLIAANTGQKVPGASASGTFDRILDQATSVPLAELRHQGLLVTNRLQQGPTLALIQRSGTMMSVLPEEMDESTDSQPPIARESDDYGGASSAAAPPPNASSAAEPCRGSGAAACGAAPVPEPEPPQAPKALSCGMLPSHGMMRNVSYGGSTRKLSPTKMAGTVSPALGAITALLNDRTAEQAVASTRSRSAEIDALREEVKSSLEQTREEMSARMDELAASIGAVHATLHALIGKLPVPTP